MEVDNFEPFCSFTYKKKQFVGGYDHNEGEASIISLDGQYSWTLILHRTYFNRIILARSSFNNVEEARDEVERKFTEIQRRPKGNLERILGERWRVQTKTDVPEEYFSEWTDYLDQFMTHSPQ